MTTDQDTAAVVRLACLTVDRTPAEQKALGRIAERIDRAVNRQTHGNRNLPADKRHLNLATAPPCTYSTEHGKDCACRGDRVAIEPNGGWSRLAELVADTWEPSE